MSIGKTSLKLEPLTRHNWVLYESLMGERGGCGGCWCMASRLSKAEFEAGKGQGNKTRMKQLVEEGHFTGLLAMQDAAAIGWMALSPREEYPRLDNSRSFKRIDDRPVWSVTCFYVDRNFRRRGLSGKMISLLCEYAMGRQEIEILEAYPAIPYSDKTPAPFLWVGILSAFLQNGFELVRQNGKSRAMVRWYRP